MNLKTAIDELAEVRQQKNALAQRDKELSKFIKSGMTGLTAYGTAFAAQLTRQIRRVLDKKKIPLEIIEKATVDQTVEILNITAR